MSVAHRNAAGDASLLLQGAFGDDPEWGEQSAKNASLDSARSGPRCMYIYIYIYIGIIIL